MKVILICCYDSDACNCNQCLNVCNELTETDKDIESWLPSLSVSKLIAILRVDHLHSQSVNW